MSTYSVPSLVLNVLMFKFTAGKKSLNKDCSDRGYLKKNRSSPAGKLGIWSPSLLRTWPWELMVTRHPHMAFPSFPSCSLTPRLLTIRVQTEH